MKSLLKVVTSVILSGVVVLAPSTYAVQSLPASKNTSSIDTQKLANILQSSHRSEESRYRDEFRNPQDVFTFFDIKPTDTVLEVWPGNGWYSEILGPYLKDNGQLIAATFSTTNQNSDDKRKAFWSRVALEYRDKVSDKSIYGDVTFTELDPPEALEVATPDSVDIALIIRS